MRKMYRFLVSLIAFIAVGCSPASKNVSPRSSDDGLQRFYAKSVDHLPKIPINVKREELRQALDKGSRLNRIRVIELFEGGGERPPRYRLLGIKEGSAYRMLGLENADVVLAADNRIMYSSAIFPQFVSLLPGEKYATIHLVRGGKEMVFTYTFH